MAPHDWRSAKAVGTLQNKRLVTGTVAAAAALCVRLSPIAPHTQVAPAAATRLPHLSLALRLGPSMLAFKGHAGGGHGGAHYSIKRQIFIQFPSPSL